MPRRPNSLRRRTQALLAAVAAVFSCGSAARADSAFPTSITVYPYPLVASPSKYPITVNGCGVFRTGHHLHMGFSFTNLQLVSMTAVKISVDLYDPFHSYLTTLDATINGDYSPGARIDVPETEQPGDRMPAFEAFDIWPSAASAVCYVSNVAYSNGDVWAASARPSLAAAQHALSDLQQHATANGQNLAKQYRAQDRAHGFALASVEPKPLAVPDGWRELSPGAYSDERSLRAGVLQVIQYVSLTGAGGAGPLEPNDIPSVRTMEGIEVTDRHAATICGDRHADYLSLRATTSSGPEIIEAMKVDIRGVAYVSSYNRSIGAAPSPEAEDALTHLCY